MSRFWIFWLQSTAGRATQTRRDAFTEASAAMACRASSAGSCGLSETARYSKGPPAAGRQYHELFRALEPAAVHSTAWRTHGWSPTQSRSCCIELNTARSVACPCMSSHAQQLPMRTVLHGELSRPDCFGLAAAALDRQDHGHPRQGLPNVLHGSSWVNLTSMVSCGHFDELDERPC